MNTFDRPVIYANYFDYLVKYLRQQGLSREQVLHGSSIEKNIDTPSQISDRDLGIVLNNAHQVLGYQAYQIGFNLGVTLNSTDHGLVGLASICADTVGDAIRTYGDYFPIISPIFSLYCHEEENYFVAEVIALNEISTPCHDFLIALGIANAGLIGLNIIQLDPRRHKQRSIIEVSSYPPPNMEMWQLFSRVSKLSFDHSHHKIKIPSNLTRLAMRSANAQTRQVILSLCQQELDKIENSFIGRVKNLIEANLDQKLNAKEAALYFAMSERSFHRKLKQQGSHYGGLYQSIKMQKAKHWLRHDTSPISEIALALGYSEFTNFSAAFKRHEGVSPSQYRSQHCS